MFSNKLIVVEQRKLLSSDEEQFFTVPLTWEELFTKNNSLLKRIYEKVKPIKIPLPVDVFEAYHLTQLPNVRVVIIGQDPYPTYSNSTGLPHAKGLAFSYSKLDGTSPSMRNVNQELRNCYPNLVLNHTCLTSWAYQGVFLLNTALTFKGQGKINLDISVWSEFISETIKTILEYNPDCIFVGWGNKAKTLLSKFNIKNLLTAAHPSPQVRQGFLGCKHFLLINKKLEKRGEYPIDWNLY